MRRLAICVLIAVGLTGRPAYGFECTEVPESDPRLTQVWTQRCLPFWINVDSGLLTDEREALVIDSFAQWSNPDCTDLEFRYAGATSQRAEFDVDSSNNRNVVIAIDSETEVEDVIESPGLLAITLTSFSVDTGEIFDADIVINAANFDFVDVSDTDACRASASPPFDLRNTLVHEVGHFIGFDHTPEPEATMFATAQACETSKRDLAVVDLTGVCAVYPAGGMTQTCAPAESYGDSAFLDRFRDQCNRIDGCDCRATRARGSSMWSGAALVIAALALRRWSLRQRSARRA